MRRFRYILHKLLDIMSITCALAIVLSVLLNENSFLSFQIWFNDFEIFTLICANYKLMLIKLSGKPTKCNCLITCSYMICSPFFLSVDGRSRNLVLSQYIIKLLPPTSKSRVVCLLCNLQLSVFFWKGRGKVPTIETRFFCSLPLGVFLRVSTISMSHYAWKGWLVLGLHTKQLWECLLFQVEFLRICLFLEWNLATVLQYFILRWLFLDWRAKSVRWPFPSL